MNLATGVDLIELARVKKAIDQHGDRFLNRIYTPKELALFGNSLESLAARFALKEAVGKALGGGIGAVSWQEIETLHDERNAPVLNLHGNARRQAEQLGLQTWSVSLSHTHHQAIAFVVAIGI
jgi:holo-[acyl-carrier protein] synthase